MKINMVFHTIKWRRETKVEDSYNYKHKRGNQIGKNKIKNYVTNWKVYFLALYYCNTKIYF